MSRKEQPGRTRVDGRLNLINDQQFAGQAFGKSGVDVQSRQSSYLANLPTVYRLLPTYSSTCHLPA
jgi:hypothetical protein